MAAVHPGALATGSPTEKKKNYNGYTCDAVLVGE
jgi:hypothetical protein